MLRVTLPLEEDTEENRAKYPECLWARFVSFDNRYEPCNEEDAAERRRLSATIEKLKTMIAAYKLTPKAQCLEEKRGEIHDEDVTATATPAADATQPVASDAQPATDAIEPATGERAVDERVVETKSGAKSGKKKDKVNNERKLDADKQDKESVVSEIDDDGATPVTATADPTEDLHESIQKLINWMNNMREDDMGNT